MGHIASLPETGGAIVTTLYQWKREPDLRDRVRRVLSVFLAASDLTDAVSDVMVEVERPTGSPVVERAADADAREPVLWRERQDDGSVVLSGEYLAASGPVRFRPGDTLTLNVDVLAAGEPVPERAGREGDSQPLPTPNAAPDVQSAVIADIEARREVGIRRYGTALQPHNGRNALLDLYEELIDACCYAKQRLIEDEARRAE